MLRATEVTARLEGTREELFEVLGDFERFGSWIPGVERCRTLSREGDVVISEVRVPEWADHSFNLELVRAAGQSLSFRQIDSIGRPEISGRIELGETDPGVGASSVRVRARLRLETPLLHLGSRRRMRAALRASLDALGARRRQLAARCHDSPPVRQKLLEVVREATGLRVWYLGESYFLPRKGAER